MARKPAPMKFVAPVEDIPTKGRQPRPVTIHNLPGAVDVQSMAKGISAMQGRIKTLEDLISDQ